MNLPSTFNFAEHLFALNRQRAEKIAYIDDQGTLRLWAAGRPRPASGVSTAVCGC